MLQLTFKQVFAKALTLVTLCFTASAFTGNAGLDSYEIYLNKKLILQQHVNQPLSLRKLPLEKANADDRLEVYYNHCTLKGAGTGRSISLMDKKGNKVKTWKFTNSAGSNTSMVIPVGELLEFNKSNDDLSLYYTAEELPEGEMLALLYMKKN